MTARVPRPVPLARIGRYALVGAVATGLHYAVLTAGVEIARWPAWLGSGAGAVAGAQLAFFGNRRFTFGHRGAPGAAWWRFNGTAAIGAVVGMAVVGALVRAGWHYLLAQVAATLVSLLVTFAINRRWTFAG